MKKVESSYCLRNISAKPYSNTSRVELDTRLKVRGEVSETIAGMLRDFP